MVLFSPLFVFPSYNFIPKLDDITLGEYIDLDNTLSDWQQMHKAMSVLYRPVTIKKNNRYQVEPYTGDENEDIFLHMPLDVVMGALLFFWNLSNELLQITLNYLSEEMKENLTTQQRQILEQSGAGINQFTESLKGILPNSMKLHD